MIAAGLAGLFTVNSADDFDLLDSVLTLREALKGVNGSLIGPFSSGEQPQSSNNLINGPAMRQVAT